MITALYGGFLLSLDESSGLGLSVFELPSSPALEASEADLLRMQINAVYGQVIGKDGAEKMSKNRIALIYSFTDLK